jgi:hypothetical protein
MRRIILLVLLFEVAAWSQTKTGDDSLFSHTAASIWASYFVNIPSPDGTKLILVRPPERPDSEEAHTVFVRSGDRLYRTKIGALVNAEAGWSPDSKAFFITYSDGLDVGTYHVRIVYPTPSGLRTIEPVPDGRKLFKLSCLDPEVPNVGAIGWVGQDSSELAIAVQVPRLSSCASKGTFKAFVLRLPSGAVVSELGQIEAKKLFADRIGSILKDSDDSCIMSPQSCIPCGLEGGRCAN